MYFIHPSVYSDTIDGFICTFQESANPRRLWVMPRTYVNNSGIVRIAVALYTILVCVVFNLSATPCKSGDIWDIIIIMSIKDSFMSLTIQILDTYPETSKTRKIGCQSLSYQAAWSVLNTHYDHKMNVLYMVKSMSKFTMILHFCLMKGISC